MIAPRIHPYALAVVVLAVLTLGGAPALAAKRAAPTYVPDYCHGDAPDWSQAPTAMAFSCTPGIAEVVVSGWRRWGSATATAKGTWETGEFGEPGCTPAPPGFRNCLRKLHVQVTASRIGYCGRRRVYDILTVVEVVSAGETARVGFSQTTVCNRSRQAPTRRPKRR